MPLRERFKQSIKEFKGDVRALLNRPGTPGPSESITPPPASIPVAPRIYGHSDSNIHLERPAGTTNQIGGDHSGVTEQSKNALYTASPITSTALMASTQQASEPNVVDMGQEPAADQTYQKTVDQVATGKGLEVFTKGLVKSSMDTLKFGPLKDISDMLQGFADMYIVTTFKHMSVLKRSERSPDQVAGSSKRGGFSLQGLLPGQGTAGPNTSQSIPPPGSPHFDEQSDDSSIVKSQMVGPSQLSTPMEEDDIVTLDPSTIESATGSRSIGRNLVGAAEQFAIEYQSPQNMVVQTSPPHTESNIADSVEQPLPEPTSRGSLGSSSIKAGLGKFVAGFMKPATGALKFGPLQDLSELIERFADLHVVDESVKKECEELRQRLLKLLGLLDVHSVGNTSAMIASKIQEIRDFIQRELNFIGNQPTGKLQTGRLRAINEEEDRVSACCRRIQGYLDEVLIDTRLAILRVEEEQSRARVERLLSSSPSAWYNSRAREELKRRECTPGTRVDVLATLLAWARNKNNSGVYWLNGMAGTGKTTIAYSVCKDLDAGGNLAASFFCSRLRDECRDVNMIIPSIAYQMARRSQSFQSALSTILEKEPDIHTKRLDTQFIALIEEPLNSANNNIPGGSAVVIDALDECENKESTSQVLQVLLSRAADLPLKFIVSSRPEPHVRDQLVGERVDSRLVLHELDTGNVQADIKTYLEVELKPMDPPPSEAQIAALVERAGVLFIYAATAVRYIGFQNFKRNPSGRLSTVLHGSQGKRTSAERDIDVLYSTILEAAFGEQGLDEDDETDMQQILHTVICAREPLTVNALSELLQIQDVSRVRGALDPMQSVLHVIEPSELVTTLHASFPDFMFDRARSKTRCCDFKAFNRQLAEHCLERIRGTQPQFNICGLESSYRFDEDVPDIDERVASAIPLGLLYACRYWANHVQVGDCVPSMEVGIQDFLSRRLFLWLEVLNLKKQVRAAVECMKMTCKWSTDFEGDQDLVELAHDARRFVDVLVSTPITQSTPHIYVSMMAFWPRTSPISKQYGKFIKGPVQAEGTALGQRQPAHLSTWEFGPIYMMAISANGLLVGLETDEGVIVVDSSSGRKMLEPLKGYPKSVFSITFSPNCARIFVGSVHGRHATIIGWDVRSGDTVLGPLLLRGHGHDIKCLSFSPDCTRIATGSRDQSARLWDVETGKERYYLRTKSTVNSTAFSPDGAYVAIESRSKLHVRDTHTGDAVLNPFDLNESCGIIAFTPDKSHIISTEWCHGGLFVWNTQSGEKIHGPIEGVTNPINCIGCSPDGRYIVSGSKDQSVCVWDAQTGRMVLGPLLAHTGRITSVSFTPDGSRIISACTNGLVCTWDAQQRILPPSPTNAPFHPIARVKFSTDGTRFVSGSWEGTISIWDAQAGEIKVGPIKAHSSYINAVDFLNDRVVSGADDGTICVCDALTGEVVLDPLQLDAGTIEVIRYSPDGQMIAAGSWGGLDVRNGHNGNRVIGPLTGLDGSVKSVQFSPDGTRIVASSEASISNLAVWDVSTGENAFGTLDGHQRGVCSVSYSPNGALIASSSWDKTIIVWDAYTGDKRLGPLTTNSDDVLSVHFSPDSTRLVSGSRDRRILIWHVETGGVVFELLHGHEGRIESVEYSPDGTRILSRSYDSVRIHDARSPAERVSRVVLTLAVRTHLAGSDLQALSECEVGDWTINKNGWVVDNQSRLLVWIPPDLQKALALPSTLRVIVTPEDYVLLKFDKSRIGESWAKSYSSGM